MLGQLRLRPAALVGRRRALVRQQLGTQPYLAPGQIRERRLEADQRSDGQRVRVQHNRSVAAATVLAGRLGVAGGPAEQRPQRHVLAERHQPRLRIRAAHTVRSDEHRRLVDSAVGARASTLTSRSAPTRRRSSTRRATVVGVAGEIDADAALTPDHEVDPLARQRCGERLTGGLTRRVASSMSPGWTSATRTVGPGAGAGPNQNHMRAEHRERRPAARPPARTAAGSPRRPRC